jgi:hypothetical protein
MAKIEAVYKVDGVALTPGQSVIVSGDGRDFPGLVEMRPGGQPEWLKLAIRYPDGGSRGVHELMEKNADIVIVG